MKDESIALAGDQPTKNKIRIEARNQIKSLPNAANYPLQHIESFEMTIPCDAVNTQLSLAQHMPNLRRLKINDLRKNRSLLLNRSLENFKHLNAIWIYGENPVVWVLPKSVRHAIYDGPYPMNYSIVREILVRHEHIETIELKNAGSFKGFKPGQENALKCKNLKKFKFNYHDKIQCENLSKMFEHADTILVPISPK